ncbi:MAG: tetratricopeptide repeat protein [Treponema sp.]|jgi:tetratricopeptide (TPR) repeat protein|nr:tetratricopeptide repeat protein [Treponema sp.]
MSMSNHLESIYYINLPENFNIENSDFKIDPTIQLPVQKKDSDSSDDFNPSEMTSEQILAGILTVLAYDKKNPNLGYYRSIINKVKPNIKKELCEAAILKAKNEDFDIAEEIFLSLIGLDPEDKYIVLNMAIFLDQRADSYRKSSLTEDADAYDNDAFQYYSVAMDAEPAIPDAFFNAGFYYMKKNQYSEARDCFDTYIALTCDLTNDEIGSDADYKKERAQEIINNIVKQNMDDIHYKNAYKLIKSNEDEKGIDEVRIFLQNNSKIWSGWFLLGWGLRKLERFEDAKTAFNESLKCVDGDENADTYNELALCYMNEKDLKNAEKCLLKALSINYEDTKIISNLGYLALAKGERENARKYFSAVLEYNPKDVIALNELTKLEKDN